MLAAAATRSNASRSEMSRTWSETRRSSGEFHVSSAVRDSVVEAHDCASTVTGANETNAAARTAIAQLARDRQSVTMRWVLSPSPRRRCPVKNRDVSLSFDAGTERKSDDIENSVNWLTGKRCGQVKIRQR